MLPIFIRSASEFYSLVQLGTQPESLVLEFKRKIDGWNAPEGKARREAQKETCRDIAQFANTLGGCLLIGVTERSDLTRGISVAESIESVDNPGKLREWIEQAIGNYLVPSTLSHDIVPISLSEGAVVAINVPAHRYLVSLWERWGHERITIEYIHRTSHGKAWMNPDEAERHLMDGSRAAKLAFNEVIEHAPSKQVEIAGGTWRRHSSSPHILDPWNPSGSISIGEMKEHWFELYILNHEQKSYSVTVPYSLIREAWLGSSGVVTLLSSHYY